MVTREEMDDLMRRFIDAETEAERDEVSKRISEAIERDAAGVAEIALAQIKKTNKRLQEERELNRSK